ncbi:MAG: hypothetical protein CVV44_20335 [Spirochaetae bacterium HGW-Spirochaetae-1]|jgi:hypothetical protein|nr:MAG: hypothetical protein CVV44_20335 [Spirochaetae bacterium HGW-Spirochaetae-1]
MKKIKHAVKGGKDVICKGQIYKPDKDGFVYLPEEMKNQDVVPVTEGGGGGNVDLFGKQNPTTTGPDAAAIEEMKKELAEMDKEKMNKVAKEMGIENPDKMKKDDLIEALIKKVQSGN